MKIPGIGIELKRSKGKQAKRFTDALAAADVDEIKTAIAQQNDELVRLDAAIAQAQIKRKKIAAKVKALEAVMRAQLVGTGKEAKEEKEETVE